MAFSDLDDDRAAADEAAHAMIGIDTGENVDALAEDRHVGAGLAWADVLDVSTHPDHWWGGVITVPSEPGADTVRALVAVEAVDGSIDLALEVAGGVGATVTVAPTGGPAIYAVTAPLPRAASGSQVYRGALRIRSHVGAVAYTRGVEEHTDVTLHTTGPTIGPLTWQACHFVGEYVGANYEPSAGDRPRFYLGSWHRAAHGSHVDFQGWPSAPDGFFIQDNAQIQISKLGRAQVHGLALSYEGAAGVGRPDPAVFRPGAVPVASSFLGLVDAVGRVYTTRPHWWISAGAGGLWGRTRDVVELVVADCLVTLRPDVVGYSIAALALGEGGPARLDVSIEFVDPATGAVVVSRSGGATLSPAVGGQSMRTDEGGPGALALYGVRRYLGGSVVGSRAWGGADLAYCAPNASDLSRYSAIRGQFGVAGLTPGATYRLRVTLPVDFAALVVTPATVTEAIEV